MNQATHQANWGMVQVSTGDGKGETTAALGVIARRGLDF
jgi:ATP:corrinoid adenosyltransferase